MLMLMIFYNVACLFLLAWGVCGWGRFCVERRRLKREIDARKIWIERATEYRDTVTRIREILMD